MKWVALVLLAAPASAAPAKPKPPVRNEGGRGVPGWLRDEVKPLVRKTVVTR